MLRRQQLAALLRQCFCGVSLLLGLLFCACSSKSLRASDPANQIEPLPAEAPPTGQKWTELYSGPVPWVSLSNREQQLWSRWSAHTAVQSCKLDANLTIAARTHAAELAAAPHTPRDADFDRLRFLLLRLGNPDYEIDSHVLRINPGESPPLKPVLGNRQGGWTHCGVGVAPDSDDGERAVWIGVRRIIEIEPFPVRVHAGTPLLLHGKLSNPNVASVSPYLGRPDGTVRSFRQLTVDTDGQFTWPIPALEPGRFQIELLIHPPQGAKIAALFPLFVGVEPDPRPVVTPDNLPQDNMAPEQQLLLYLNAARKRMGLSPLIRDKRLDQVAGKHSREMVKRSFFGHISPYTGTLQQRLEARDLQPRRSAENLAQSRTVLRIHRNLMSSPSHRINIIDPGFTHIGLGLAETKNGWIATQVFARW